MRCWTLWGVEWVGVGGWVGGWGGVYLCFSLSSSGLAS